MRTAFFLILFATTSLLACGKREKTPVPVTSLPAATASQTESAPAVAPEPVVSAATPEVASAAKSTAAAMLAKPADIKPAPVVQPGHETTSSIPKPDLAHGQQIYRQSCAFCHDKGVAGAPKTGDAAAWSPRLAQGMDALYASALRGKGAMPAKGGNPSLPDDDVKAAVNYLSAQAR